MGLTLHSHGLISLGTPRSRLFGSAQWSTATTSMVGRSFRMLSTPDAARVVALRHSASGRMKMSLTSLDILVFILPFQSSVKLESIFSESSVCVHSPLVV